MKSSFAGVVYRCFAVVILTGLSAAQVLTGIQPFGSYSGGPFDTVNLGNLNVHFAVPIRHKAGRGAAFSYDLTYDNSVWQIVTSGSNSSWQPVQTASGFGSYWGWQNLGPVYSPYVSYSVVVTNGQCFNGGQLVPYTQWVFSNFVYHDANATAYPFSYSDAYIQSPGGSNCPPNGPQPATGPYTTHVGPYTLTLNTPNSTGSTSGVLTDSSGTTINAPFLTTPPSSPNPFTTTDRNGNKITESNGTYTDTLGTTVLAAVGTPPTNTTFTYMAPNQQNVAYTVSYAPYTVQTAFNCNNPTITDYPPTTQNLVDKIMLPDNTTFYQFKYETTPGDNHTPHYVTARISEVDLPTGGTVKYDYGTTGAVNCADGTALTLNRKLDSNTTWQYSRAQVGSDSHWQTTIIDPTPALNQTLIDFQSSFYETQRVAHQGTSTGPVLSTTIRCYNTANPTPTTCSTTAVSAPISRRTIFSYLPDAATGVAAETDTQYLNGDPAEAFEIDSYDYGSKGGGVGALIRKVNTGFGTFNPVSGVCFALGNSIATTPCMVTVQNGAGTTVAKTTYTYDEVTPSSTTGTPQHTTIAGSRGNLTTMATQVNGTTTLYRKFTYFDTGTPNTATDAGKTSSGGPNVTNYIYDNSGTAPHTKDCGNSFVTTINEPLSLSRSFSWDCDGGVMTSVTDENTKIATTSYTGTGADPDYWRPYQAQDQLTNTTTFSYPSATASESTMLFNTNNSSVVDHRTKLDDLGRPIISQTLQAPGGSTYDATEVDYDVAGRVATVTRPYSVARDTLCTINCFGITVTYDALGRTNVVTDGGGGTVTSTYSFNDSLQVIGPLTTGEHFKQKQLEYDALGRLTSVCEITSTSGSGTCGQNSSPQPTGFWTKYTYDALGNMTGVTQNAQAASGSQQTRTYVFDMAGRLTSELNPETGSTAITSIYDSWDSSCGSYTSAGDLVEKKDAMGNVTCLKYDALHRPTDVTYPSGTYASVTAQKHYVYDAAAINSITMVNVKGRLAEAYTGTSGSKTTDLGFTYSARGEVTDVWESTPNSGGYYHVNTSYWANGKLNVLNGGTNPLPGLPAITYGVNSEGRASVVSATGQNPITATSYNVAHQVTGLTFGSGDSDSYTYDPKTGRMTQYQFSMGASPNTKTDTGVLTWNPNGTLGQLQITDQINTGNSQTCTFGHDDLVRITSANCASAWSQTFAFDPFGNLSKTGSAQFLPIYTGTAGAGAPTNQYYQISGGASGTSNYYDSNGNLKNDISHSYTWDADGNNLSVDGSTVTMIYDAMDRMIEQTRGSAHTQIVYGPYGMKLALMNGQLLVNAFVKLPGGARAVYNSSGLAYYRHSDHLGSSRLATTPSRTNCYDVSYGAYGEDYNGTGSCSTDLAFTDQNQDTVKGGWSTNLYDFMFRGYRTAHGRWTSPDPAGLGAVDPGNPQSLNRYAYVLNNPLSLVDPLGSDDCDNISGSGSCQGFTFYADAVAPFTFHADVFATGMGGGVAYPDSSDGEFLYRMLSQLLGAAPAFPSLPPFNPPVPCPSVPQAPPGANVNSNIKTAQMMQALTYTDPLLSLYVFKKTVGNKMVWDYKQRGWTLTDTGQLGPSPFQDFGNFNFGATGAAWGIPLNILERGAGYAQGQAGTSTADWGNWYQGPPYGDDPADQAQINAGYQYYKNGCNKKK